MIQNKNAYNIFTSINRDLFSLVNITTEWNFVYTDNSTFITQTNKGKCLI